MRIVKNKLSTLKFHKQRGEELYHSSKCGDLHNRVKMQTTKTTNATD